jgi:predicted signal transduction protein with EAL and GGDEF domain
VADLIRRFLARTLKTASAPADLRSVDAARVMSAGAPPLDLDARRRRLMARGSAASFAGTGILALVSSLAGGDFGVHDVLARPFAVGDTIVQVTASVGVGMSAADAFDADTLVAAADAAMYSAKRTARRDQLRSVS